MTQKQSQWINIPYPVTCSHSRITCSCCRCSCVTWSMCILSHRTNQNPRLRYIGHHFSLVVYVTLWRSDSRSFVGDADDDDAYVTQQRPLFPARGYVVHSSRLLPSAKRTPGSRKELQDDYCVDSWEYVWNRENVWREFKCYLCNRYAIYWQLFLDYMYLSIYLPIMSNPFWGPRHMRVKLHIVNLST